MKYICRWRNAICISKRETKKKDRIKCEPEFARQFTNISVLTIAQLLSMRTRSRQLCDSNGFFFVFFPEKIAIEFLIRGYVFIDKLKSN